MHVVTVSLFFMAEAAGLKSWVFETRSMTLRRKK
jgi:hypothetical protein